MTSLILPADISDESVLSKYRGASPEAIQAHYDLSNSFYELWLDSTLSYSCAMWKEGESSNDLARAQIRKLDYFIQQSKLNKSSRILEVGCGWGALLNRLKQVLQTEHLTGLTLSQAQLNYIRTSTQSESDIRLENWFDHLPKEPYDAIISIEAFEAFAKPGLSQKEKIDAYRHFFKRCHQWLVPRGYLVLQTISYGNMLQSDIKPLITNNIFPESDLPRLSEITAAIDPLFEVVTIHNNRQDYVRTLKAWLKRLKENRLEAIDIVGEERVVHYENYLKHSMLGFASGAQNLLRITLRRTDNPVLL